MEHTSQYQQPHGSSPLNEGQHASSFGGNHQGYPGKNQSNDYHNQRQNGYGNQQHGGYQKKPYGQGGGYQQGGFQRKPKPDFGPIELYKPYTMVSNREVPLEIMAKMTAIAKQMDALGFTCRVDGAEGASAAVEPVECRKELMLAWKGFNEKDSAFTYTMPEALEIAKKFHPTFDTAKPAVQTFLARNVRLVMGQTLKSPIMAMVVYTDDGAESGKDRTSKTGFAGHLIALASALGVPVFNLHSPDAERRLKVWLEKHNASGDTETRDTGGYQKPSPESVQTYQGNPNGYQY